MTLILSHGISAKKKKSRTNAKIYAIIEKYKRRK